MPVATHLPSPRTSTNGPVPASVARKPMPALVVTDEAVAMRAYEKYVARGCVHGFDQEDWTTAQRELSAEAFGGPTHS